MWCTGRLPYLRRAGPAAGVVLLAAVLLSARAFAEEDFKQWKQQQRQDYQEYKDKRDKEFTAFLKMHWTEMQLLQGTVRDPQPKPDRIPVARPLPESEIMPAPPVVLRPPLPLPPSPPPAVKPLPQPGLPSAASGRRISLDYYGTALTFYYDQKLKAPLGSPLNESAVSAFWSALSKADYDALIAQVDAQRTALQLNDWAYLLLVNETSKQIFPLDESRQNLFTWFMLAKAGYSARIAYDKRNVYLLVPANQPLYAVPYFTLDDLRYYAVRFDGSNQKLGKVYTYKGHYPGTHRQLDMILNHDMVVADAPAKRKLTFNYEGKQYNIEAAYSARHVAYLNTYPQLDLEIYFNSNLSATTAAPLLLQLSTDMQGMNQKQAVNFLLRFVQTSFQYKTDEAQFGRENYLFPEETLFYPYSDCEDRSILFAWLVKKLLGLEVIGLDYPGHVATAVHFTESVSGDAINFDEKRYVIADPTYVNASVGTTMPEYIKKKPTVIRIQ